MYKCDSIICILKTFTTSYCLHCYYPDLNAWGSYLVFIPFLCSPKPVSITAAEWIPSNTSQFVLLLCSESFSGSPFHQKLKANQSVRLCGLASEHLLDFSSLSLFFNLARQHWPLCCSLNRPGNVLPQGLCTLPSMLFLQRATGFLYCPNVTLSDKTSLISLKNKNQKTHPYSQNCLTSLLHFIFLLNISHHT